ncbi:MAG: outer membrane protein assembly factor BamA [Planctomycetota bacterium]
MSPVCHALVRLNIPLLCLLITSFMVNTSHAQALEPEGRRIVEVRIEGRQRTTEVQVRNHIRTEPGNAYSQQVIDQDLYRLTELGLFEQVLAGFKINGDGTVDVVFTVIEQPVLTAIRFTGNKHFDQAALLSQVLLLPGDPIDTALIDRAVRAMQKEYEDDGFFAATITYNAELLAERRELAYSIVEGPRVRVVEISYQGNKLVQTGALSNEVSSREYFWPFNDGWLDQNKLNLDVASIRQLYYDRGYLEAQVGRRIEISDRQNRATVVFLIDEGPQYRVNTIRSAFTRLGQPIDDQVMSPQQIPMLLELVPGGVFSDEAIRRSERAVAFWYGKLGYIDVDVNIERRINTQTQQVDLVVNIEEGPGATILGKIEVIGNTRTDRRVLLRRIRGLEPGRPLDLQGLQQTRGFVRESIYFNQGTITLLGEAGDPVRDMLIEVSEKNTGSFNIGAGISSDSGVFGTIGLEQRNFDAADWPESWDEFFAGRAFLGAGQTFNINLSPGNENSNYSIGFREPYIFETDYFFDFQAFAFQSEREDFDEGRLGVRAGVGRRLGDAWSGVVRARVVEVDIDDIEAEAPVDVFDVQGQSLLTSVGFSLTRSRTDSNITPSRGNRLTLGVDQIGVFGGDYDFTRVNVGFAQFWTLDEDFLGRKSILSFRADAGYLLQDADDVPLFERYYAGGRQFRGFAFRGVGPRGIRNDTLTLGDDPVGGQFQFIARLEYEMPLYDQVVRWAVFTDHGTVQDEFGFDEWRVTVGTGLRFVVPFFGQFPFAIDFAVPLLDEQGDETQIFSFDLNIPFR